MAYEIECDTILRTLSENDSSMIYADDLRKLISHNIDDKTLIVALSGLLNDGHIISGYSVFTSTNLNNNGMTISPMGKVFVSSTSYGRE